MKLLLGPLLHARSSTPTTWHFAIGLLLDGAPTDPGTSPSLEVTFTPPIPGAEVQPKLGSVLAEVPAAGSCSSYWVWEVAVPRGEGDLRFDYRIASADGAPAIEGLPVQIGTVCVPAKGALPRLAFFSCNGTEDLRDFLRMPEPEALWHQMRDDHDTGGFHVLVGGGDQIYADSLWEKNEHLREWRRQRLADRVKAPVPDGFSDQILRDYVKMYCERWAHRHGAGGAFARIPTVFTWDDHDIFDGWGSHSPEEQRSPTFKAVFEAAKRTFRTFQLGGDAVPNGHRTSPAAPHFLQALTLSGTEADLDLVLLDLRGERTLKQVLSATQWDDLADFLDKHAARKPQDKTRPRHLLVVSSIPVVHMRFGGGTEWAAGAVELRDDLRDHWESPAHRGERARLIMTLLEHAKRADCAITILSGDVHIGARGRIVSVDPDHRREGRANAIIEQVTSSGIVFPPPGWFEFRGMRLLAREGKDDLSGSVSTEIVPVGGDTYLAARNWLSIRFDKKKHRAWLQWQTAEGGVEPMVVVEP